MTGLCPVPGSGNLVKIADEIVNRLNAPTGGHDVSKAIGRAGKFAIFPNEAAGIAAQEALLMGTYAGKTIDETITAWAPSEDGNDTARYQALVHQWTGLSGDQKIGNLTPEGRHILMAAQRRMEGWKPGSISGSSSQ
jgi:hypothetical protein